jgi:hypothetical protein
MMDALSDHVEEIKNILDDIENDDAQRAAIDLLFGEVFEDPMTEICQSDVAANIKEFC